MTIFGQYCVFTKIIEDFQFSIKIFGKKYREDDFIQLCGSAVFSINKMLVKLKCIKNEQLRRFSEHGLYMAFTLLFIPGLTFELCVVLPALIEKGSVLFYGHLAIAAFLLFNFLGNMYKGMSTNTTIRGINLEGFNKEDWTLCSTCECLRPPRSWHCDVCEACVLHRDHHCKYLANCIGYFNRRYFMMYTLYTFIGLMASLVYNIVFLYPFLSWNYGLLLIKALCPPLFIIFDFSLDSFCVLFLEMNIVGASLTGIILFLHLVNILKGRLYPEKKLGSKYLLHNKGWRLNLIEAFGSRWYLIWISPFIQSELPGIEFELPIQCKSKSE